MKLTTVTACFAAFFPVAASAADLGHDWGGFYVGGQVGSASSDYALELGGTPPEWNAKSAFGGLKVGFDRQFGSLVAGVSVEGNLMSLDGAIERDFGYTETIATHQSQVGSLDLRLGWAHDNVLLYAIGGIAVIEAELSLSNDVPDPAGNWKSTMRGYDVGAGVEYALDKHWSVFGEYRHYDFSNMKNDANNGWLENELATSQQSIRLGFNYKL